MLRQVRFTALLVLTAVCVLALAAIPAGAQQLVDAGKDGDGSGGLAFVLFAVMVFVCGGAMFFMDHVRRSRLHQEDDSQQ